jgi:ABC-type spermidine/putrescine transport system permease subunit I
MTVGAARLWSIGFLAPPLIAMLVFFLGPLGYLLYVSLHEASATDLYGASLTIANYAAVFSDPFYLIIVQRTLATAAAILALSLLIGYPVAYVIARLPAQKRTLVMLVLLFPLMVSNVVRAYGWIAILGRRGVVNQALNDLGLSEAPLSLLYNTQAIAIGLLTILLPYMVISIANALANLDPRYHEAAQALGASPMRTFVHVTLPLSAPGIASGLLLVFLLTLSAYVTITLLGGPRTKLLVSLVYDSVVGFQWPQAAALAFVLLALALVVTALILAVVRPDRVQGAR